MCSAIIGAVLNNRSDCVLLIKKSKEHAPKQYEWWEWAPKFKRARSMPLNKIGERECAPKFKGASSMLINNRRGMCY